MGKLKISFRKHEQATGLAAVGNPEPPTAIKLNGQIVGMISAPAWKSKSPKWQVSFRTLKDDSVKWVTMTAKFDDELGARLWVKRNIATINAIFTWNN